MGWMVGAAVVLVVLVEVAFSLPLHELRVGYYAVTCPHAERIVRQAIERGMQQDRSIIAGVLRLHFHDCFVEVHAPVL